MVGLASDEIFSKEDDDFEDIPTGLQRGRDEEDDAEQDGREDGEEGDDDSDDSDDDDDDDDALKGMGLSKEERCATALRVAAAIIQHQS